MTKRKERVFGLITILVLASAFIGCGGGGGTSGGGSNTPPPSTPPPSVQVVPTSYNFGTVTEGNSPAPLEVKINNTGTVALQVSNIVLSDTTNFRLNTSAGSNPCGGTSAVVAAGGTCTFEVDFIPTSNTSFTSSVRISSNDPANLQVPVQLSGISEQIQSLIVRINQFKRDCITNEATAYLSVQDQGGYPITTLTTQSFLIYEGNNYPFNPTNVQFVSTVNPPISIAFVMDYSESITNTPDATSDMEKGLVEFVANMQPVDTAEVVKFDSGVRVVREFTNDQTLLSAAILSLFDEGTETRLYDAIFQAITDTALQANERKAVIVITDGENDDFISTYFLNDVISSAQAAGIPIFPIGIGNIVGGAALQQMADDSGGYFFQALNSDNLRTIYQQLSSILFENQYVLTYNSQLDKGGDVLRISAIDPPTIPDEDTMQVAACP